VLSQTAGPLQARSQQKSAFVRGFVHRRDSASALRRDAGGARSRAPAPGARSRAPAEVVTIRGPVLSQTAGPLPARSLQKYAFSVRFRIRETRTPALRPDAGAPAAPEHPGSARAPEHPPEMVSIKAHR
jgi:hypothetical protein